MNKTKITLCLVLFAFIITALPNQVRAEEAGASGRNIGQIKKELRQDVKDTLEDVKATQKDIRSSLRDDLISKTATRVGALKKFFEQRAVIRKGQITAMSETFLTVLSEGKSFKVLIDEKTKLRRRFYGKAVITEFAPGQDVNVIGKWADENRTTIQAQLIRNLSIQRRFGVFVGEVTAISGNDVTVKTVHRGSVKATISTTTKIVDRKMQTLKQADVLVGHRIRIKGLWDMSDNTVTEVTQLKDYTLPVVKSSETLEVTQ